MTEGPKEQIRARCIHLRKQIPLANQEIASQKVSERIIQLEEYRAAQHIALYQAVRGEINLTLLWHHATLEGKCCYFPVIDQKQLFFLPATPASPFKKNQFGIKEPDGLVQTAISLKRLDLVLMPLVAFDPLGTRIGMGAGFYDRTFAHEKPDFLMGVAYEFQCHNFIEPDAWDIALNAVVTEKKVYRISLD